MANLHSAIIRNIKKNMKKEKINKYISDTEPGHRPDQTSRKTAGSVSKIEANQSNALTTEATKGSLGWHGIKWKEAYERVRIQQDPPTHT